MVYPEMEDYPMNDGDIRTGLMPFQMFLEGSQKSHGLDHHLEIDLKFSTTQSILCWP